MFLQRAEARPISLSDWSSEPARQYLFIRVYVSVVAVARIPQARDGVGTTPTFLLPFRREQ